MSRFILIHGAWHGGWCWEKVVPLLQQAGYRVETPDLPGSGSDTTPLEEVSLEAYTQRNCQVIDAQEEPVILVGHSLGGLAITQAAEPRSERIERLIYLAAALPPNGESLLSLAARLGAPPSLPPYLLVDAENQSCRLKEEALPELYAACTDTDISSIRTRLRPQAMNLYATPLAVTTHRYGTLPKTSITCLRDPVISPAFQKQMSTLVLRLPRFRGVLNCGS